MENVRTEIDARGNSTVFEMDELERVVAITDPDGHTQAFIYDGVNKIEEIDKRNHGTQFEYDRLNRLEKVTDALDQDYMTDYLDAARQVVETDKRDIIKTTQLDSLGRVVSVNRAGVILEQHEYDANSNRTLSIDGEGNKTRFEYDGASRMTSNRRLRKRSCEHHDLQIRQGWKPAQRKRRTRYRFQL